MSSNESFIIAENNEKKKKEEKSKKKGISAYDYNAYLRKQDISLNLSLSPTQTDKS